jgi:glycerol uptake facilitator-like aquaporin
MRARRAAAECVGTALLLATVVGSGIMGERLSGGSIGLALLANSIATGAVLAALILAVGPVSGAHLNPLVSVAAGWHEEVSWREVRGYVAAQVVGAVLGVVVANLMFELPAISLATHARHGPAQWLSEFVATFGLLLVVRGSARRADPMPAALAVGGYIAAAYWFTSSTSFANPAVTLARALSDTFAGIRLADVPGFALAQIAGAAAAVVFTDWITKPRGVRAPE